MKTNITEGKKELAKLIPQVQKKLNEVNKRTTRLGAYDRAWTKIFDEWRGIFESYGKMLELTQGGHGMEQIMPAMHVVIKEALLFMNEANKFQQDLREYYKITTIFYKDFANKTNDINDETLGHHLNAVRAFVSGNKIPGIVAKGDELLKECVELQPRLDAINKKLKAAKPIVS